MLVQMIYASRLCLPAAPETMPHILRTARKNNPLHGLTGVLLFDANFVLQAIEGESHEVNSLIRQLVKDPRHTDFHLLRFGSLEERIFPNWSMGYASNASAHAPFLFKHGNTLDFNPYTLTEAQASAILIYIGGLSRAVYAQESEDLFKEAS